MSSDSLDSSFLEKLTEHAFLADLLQEAYLRHRWKVEVSRAEVDASGFDVVLEANGIVRHVQLKSSGATARTASQGLHLALGNKASGCVVWIVRHPDRDECRYRFTYRFFGAGPGDPLPALEAFPILLHTKRNKEGVRAPRPKLRTVAKKHFEEVATTAALLDRLFGPPPSAAGHWSG